MTGVVELISLESFQRGGSARMSCHRSRRAKVLFSVLTDISLLGDTDHLAFTYLDSLNLPTLSAVFAIELLVLFRYCRWPLLQYVQIFDD